MTTSNPVFGKDRPKKSGMTATPSEDRSRSYERYLLRRVLDAMGSPRFAVALWDGFKISPKDATPVATVNVHSRSALNQLLRQGDMGFGDAFSNGGISVEGDLVAMLVAAFTVPEPTGIAAVMKSLQQRKPRANTKDGSRENIHHHYDIGNDFYRLWLDKEMQYTCAYFPEDELTIEAAQQAKMDHICRKLQLRPGDRVAEAGCGWGGLARHMALNYGATVSSWNVSAEQVQYATDRAKAEGYDDRVTYVLDDYRNITGEYDAFVSVGMLEHVGLDNYTELGGVVDRCLTQNGRALVHTIGRNRPRLMNAWIEKRIFPGAYPPTIKEMMEIFEPNRFSVLDVENLRLHYAKTLAHWLARYDASDEQVQAEFGEDFARAWRLYLAGSQAAFLAGGLQLFQVVFTRERNNELAATRRHLYS
ncbi:MAG TPA: cyclopropane-fatty-acyl-phospholipid synthase [Gammaproteobacteria bacterium]|jgi:cyclopropane-fatty-acyl-phospholipid synthase|nr:MAG: cyclopropane-fatty-acyl-phospholipid synthase [Proteobacteria bacterium TMED154]PDH32236.1 MAG: cyclopropane-fatty-acyl-phospholipid synthase [Candidatus Thioglobus sp. MED-G23]HAU42137.1 cyclopropane-fatty-acyl-phospholipid synthase [Gammaproteobacteria bacterium]HBP85386.1 cyclopropane-fatty-acyl-phospholipid synthase [Gammaproteobacteria bacterium]|tara:strand:+ start:5544 stop:6800 length:1257 start_codon:yes stop_codon:yes gene_type:complete